MKYDVCRYGMADVTTAYVLSDTIQPNTFYLGVKREKYDVGVTTNHASLMRVTLAAQMIILFQLCVLAHIAITKVYH